MDRIAWSKWAQARAARVRDLERIAKDPEPVFGGEDGHSINLNLFVLKAPGATPAWGTGTSEIKSFASSWKMAVVFDVQPGFE